MKQLEVETDRREAARGGDRREARGRDRQT